MHAAIRELKEETGLNGEAPELVMVMGEPQRDPRKHIVSVVYEVNVSEEQQPIAGDDAADARFWPIDTLLSGEVEFAGDHFTILQNWLNQ
jgi:8-oxo-dGTP diphosphatase